MRAKINEIFTFPLYNMQSVHVKYSIFKLGFPTWSTMNSENIA